MILLADSALVTIDFDSSWFVSELANFSNHALSSPPMANDLGDSLNTKNCTKNLSLDEDREWIKSERGGGTTVGRNLRASMSGAIRNGEGDDMVVISMMWMPVDSMMGLVKEHELRGYCERQKCLGKDLVMCRHSQGVEEVRMTNNHIMFCQKRLYYTFSHYQF